MPVVIVRTITSLFVCALAFTCPPGLEAAPSIDEWMNATIRVNDGRGNNSSAILVSEDSARPEPSIYLVLNKHFLDRPDSDSPPPASIRIFVNVANGDESPRGEEMSLDIYFAEAQVFRHHPEPSVDVMAIDATLFFARHPEIVNRPIPISEIANDSDAAPNVADDVLMVGYPIEMAHARAYSPIVRRAMIANRPDQRPMIEAQFPSGERDQFELRGFLIDGFILPGSSGAPVVLSRPLNERGGAVADGLPFLGIVSRTTFTRIRLGGGDLPILSGIGIVFERATILETIGEFKPN